MLRIAVPVAVAILIAGCGSDGGGMSGQSEAAKEAELGALSRAFGEHVRAGDMYAARAMCSRALQERMPLAEFATAFSAQEAEYHQFGPPIAVGDSYNTLDPTILTREDYEIPQEVPSEPRWEAYTCALMTIEGTAELPVRCYEISLLWVREDGAYRVAHFEHTWCD